MNSLKIGQPPNQKMDEFVGYLGNLTLLHGIANKKIQNERFSIKKKWQ